jgi:hypothetical protein
LKTLYTPKGKTNPNPNNHTVHIFPTSQQEQSQMTKTSPAKPKPNPQQTLIELLEDSGAIFQAVGIIPGDVVPEDITGLLYLAKMKIG